LPKNKKLCAQENKFEMKNLKTVSPDSQVKQGVAIGRTWRQLPRILHQQVDFPPVVFTSSQLDQ
jgi:hypothetical protein